MYSFFEEYKKFLLCLFLFVLLLVLQQVFKHDFNDAINAVLNILIVALGGGAVKFSVLKTSERERLNSAPVSSPDDKKYFKEAAIKESDNGIIPTILIALTFTAFLSGSVIITGCSSQQVCYDCTKGPLSWQGNILGLTSGRYIETACFKIDTWKIIQQISAGEISWTDLLKNIKVEVVIKDGEFCDPNDKSYYKITLQSDDADKDKKVIYTKSDAIIPKDNK